MPDASITVIIAIRAVRTEGVRPSSSRYICAAKVTVAHTKLFVKSPW